MNRLKTPSPNDDFNEILKQYTVKKAIAVANVKSRITEVLAAKPTALSIDEVAAFFENKAQTLSLLMSQYICAKMNEKFPLLDPQLLSFNRQVLFDGKSFTIIDGSSVAALTKSTDETTKAKTKKEKLNTLTNDKSTGKSRQVTVRLVCNCEYPRTKDFEIGRITRSRDEYYSTNVPITVKIPDMPPDVKTACIKALGKWYQLIGELYTDNELSTTLSFKAITDQLVPTLQLLWIPPDDTICISRGANKVQEYKDMPVGVSITVNDRMYLITTFIANNTSQNNEESNIFQKYAAGDLVITA